MLHVFMNCVLVPLVFSNDTLKGFVTLAGSFIVKGVRLDVELSINTSAKDIS